MSNERVSLFYAQIDGEKKGPFSTDNLRTMLTDGHLKRETMVWLEGMENWDILAEVLKEYLPTPPPIVTASPSLKIQQKAETGSRNITCSVCGGVNDARELECTCCGTNLSSSDNVAGNCPDCKTEIVSGQWFCTKCYCPLDLKNKRFLKILEKYQHVLGTALALVPRPVLDIFENGDETLEYRIENYIVTNKRIVKYSVKREGSFGVTFLLSVVGLITGVLIAHQFSGGRAIFFSILLGLVGIGAGLLLASIINSVMADEKSNIVEISTTVNLEDITTKPDPKSFHTHVGNFPVDRYWVQFGSLRGNIEIDTPNFDEALSVASAISEAIDRQSSGKPSPSHMREMILKRMKSKGLSVSNQTQSAA